MELRTPVEPSNAEREPSDPAPIYGSDHPHKIPGEFLFKLTEDATDIPGLARSMARAHGGDVQRTWRGVRGFWGRFPEAALEGLRRNPFVEHIEYNVFAQPNDAPGAQDVSDGNWGLDRIDQRNLPLNGQFTYPRDGSGIRIWFIGVGVDASHPELQGRVDNVHSFSVGTGSPFSPCFEHETEAAILASGTTYGVAKGATIAVARTTGSDCDRLTHAHVVTAFDSIAAASPRPAVVSLTWDFGECTWWDATLGKCTTMHLIEDALIRTVESGIPVVASAGNRDNDHCNTVPSRREEAISVGAVNAADERVVKRANYPSIDWGSNYGSCLDLFAPGFLVDIGEAAPVNGTSAAAPLVAGVLATVLQVSATDVATSLLISDATTGVLSEIGSESPNKLLFSHIPLLNAVIVGPTYLEMNEDATWFAVAQNGSGQYSYRWSKDGVLVGTGASYSTSVASDFRLHLRITDNITGEQDQLNKNIFVACGGLDQKPCIN